MLGFVIRNCKVFRRYKTKILIYNSLVRSVLEYCTVVWRPHYATHSLRLERVQKRFLRHLSFSADKAIKAASYNVRLRHFRMQSLESRRNIADVMFLFKVLRNDIDCPQLLATLSLRAPARMPRTPITPLCPPLRRSVLGSCSPVPRLCKLLNRCSHVTDIHHDTSRTFKKSVTSILGDLSLKGYFKFYCICIGLL